MVVEELLLHTDGDTGDSITAPTAAGPSSLHVPTSTEMVFELASISNRGGPQKEPPVSMTRSTVDYKPP